jgi:hypothetical protein
MKKPGRASNKRYGLARSRKTRPMKLMA